MLVTVVTLHGIGIVAQREGYARPLLHGLSRRRLPPLRVLELFWRGAVLGPIGYWLLGNRRFMRSAQSGLDEVCTTADDGSLFLVTHSAGCRIAMDWFVHNGPTRKIAAWVSCGANSGVIEGLAAPLGFKPAHLPKWTHVWRDGDILGGPLNRFGAQDVKLPKPLIAEHMDYWRDPRFAAQVSKVIQETV